MKASRNYRGNDWNSCWGGEEGMQLSEARDILNDMYFEREQQHEKTSKKISTSPRLVFHIYLVSFVNEIILGY